MLGPDIPAGVRVRVKNSDGPIWASWDGAYCFHEGRMAPGDEGVIKGQGDFDDDHVILFDGWNVDAIIASRHLEVVCPLLGS